ncbi:Transposase IS66 family protein (plasmid) [Piscirickettsia salmonis]|nr:Transposase IS66 family protein [Piscirickettsia salmonis]QGP61874.1 Transposase IS66 family protein [Piscirickettsia salmonis]QGP66510.1 Transposase IS66 family protein [Piscirickettsia salmonis]
MLSRPPKGHRFPAQVISYVIWLYHRFSLSYRDIEEMMAERGLRVSYESVRRWCKKFARPLTQRLRKKEAKRSDKWHLDEVTIKINGDKYVLWRAVDSEGYELDIFIQKRKNKKSAMRFLKRLLGSNPAPRVIVTDKLRSYNQPIKKCCPNADHRKHKGLNNRVENAHQPTRRREKSLIKMKSTNSAQKMLKLMGVTRNFFAVDVGRYRNPASVRRQKLSQAFQCWNDVTAQVLCA